jgi:hypothetical protein
VPSGVLLMRTVLKVICAVQADLAAAGIAKGDTNTFDNYKFRGIDAVLNALAPLLSKHGLIIMPSVTSSEIRGVQSSQGKPQQHAKVTVDYTLYDTEGDSITHSFVGEGMDRGDKAINKACTAAFKYFLFEAFCIPVEGTPDADSESPEVGDTETPEMVEAGVQLNDCLEQDDYLGAAQVYAEWSHPELVIIARAPSKGGELSTANRSKLKSTEFREAFNQVRGIAA